MENIETILKNNKLRSTSCRKETIIFFLSKNYAISQPELEKNLSKFDRVTLYRTLNAFLYNGIIHKVLDDTGITKYALCSKKCSQHQHQHEHVHFKCLTCGNTQCIDSIPIPTVKLPIGFSFTDSNYLIRGVCKNCK